MVLGKKMLLLAAFCGLAWGQTGLTTIQDTLFKADGTLFNGSLTIQWSTFDANNIGTIVQQSKTVTVVNGNLLVQLVPNATAQPPANVYTVQYQSDGREQFAETWTVPVSTLPLKVAEVRTGSQVSSGAAGGSISSGSPIPESSVVGLQADLAQRPLKGAGFGTNAVAMVDDNGMIETAVGRSGRVRICGWNHRALRPADLLGRRSSGRRDRWREQHVHPRQYAARIEPDAVPQRPLHDANYDYTLTGSAIQFAAGATPQPGDTLTASYRVDTSAGGNITALTVTGGSIHTAGRAGDLQRGRHQHAARPPGPPSVDAIYRPPACIPAIGSRCGSPSPIGHGLGVQSSGELGQHDDPRQNRRLAGRRGGRAGGRRHHRCGRAGQHRELGHGDAVPAGNLEFAGAIGTRSGLPRRAFNGRTGQRHADQLHRTALSRQLKLQAEIPVGRRSCFVCRSLPPGDLLFGNRHLGCQPEPDDRFRRNDCPPVSARDPCRWRSAGHPKSSGS